MTTGIDALDTTVQKTNLLLNELAADLGWQNRKQQAYALLRTVLQTLRDRLPMAEAVNFGAQLPQLLRGMYYEGWEPTQAPKKMDQQEFLQEIRRRFPLATEESTPELISIAMRRLAYHIDPRVLDDIREELPSDVAALLPSNIDTALVI